MRTVLRPFTVMGTVFLLATTGGCSADESEKSAAATNGEAPQDFDDADLHELTDTPPKLTTDRLPPGAELRRCLLAVDGRTYIDGPCAYFAYEEDRFSIHGERQIFEGIDYPAGFLPNSISTDYIAQVEHSYNDGSTRDDGWQAFWNEEPRASHVQAWLGEVDFDGECYANSRTRLCVWDQ